ncbi:suppressor protein stp22 of temperature-sensitive alpha-factor receptor and arginine permease, partial [Coemansia aciculifera]
MGMDATRQWLLENTKNRFPHPQRVYGLIVSALSEFRSLQPKLAEYVGEDKRRQALLCLHGTLPVVFNGATFNIPVVFWFPQRFPEHPPLAYVTPTRTMVVKVSKHVDERGRVYHPYLASWADTSTLGDLFRSLIAIFSAEPPVYSRPPGHTPLPAAAGGGPPSPALGSPAIASLQPQMDTASMTASMPSLPHVGFVAPQAAVPRPMTSVESDLASVHTTGSAAVATTNDYHHISNNNAPAVPKTQQTSDSANASADSIEQGMGRVSLDMQHNSRPSTPPVPPPPVEAAHPSPQLPPQSPPEYKFNAVSGRPPIPVLSPVPASNESGSKFAAHGTSPMEPT